MPDRLIHNLFDLCDRYGMILSLKGINIAVQRQDPHLIDTVPVFLRIGLAKCYQLVIDEDRYLQAGGELPPEFAV